MRTRMLSVALVVVTGAVFAVAAAEKHEGKVAEINKGKLTMTDMGGKNKHTHDVRDSAQITLDGKDAKLADLKAGDKVEVLIDRGAITSVVAKRSTTSSAKPDTTSTGRREVKVFETGKNKLTVTDLDGKNKRVYEVTDTAKITLNDKSAKLSELKSGDKIEVVTDNGGTVTSVVAKSGSAVTRTARKIPDNSWRASKILGANVKNTNGDDLGKIEDFVVDPSSGKTKYAVLSFGGFLGIGDKWFAIPWHALQGQRDSDEKFHFVLNVSKERLKNAPGFDKNAWPDVGNPKWSDEVDTFYPEQAASLSKD